MESLIDGVYFFEPLTRARFNELNNYLFQKSMGHVKKATEYANLHKNQINDIFLLGGSTKISMVQQLLIEYTKEIESTNRVIVNADEIVAIDAAIQGGILNGDDGDIITGTNSCIMSICR